MTDIEPIVVSTTIDLPAETAFDIFIDEVDRWWRPGPHFWNDPARAVGIRFERGVGGRWIELHDLLGDDVYVMGEITAWSPGVSMSFSYRSGSLGDRAFPVDIWFESGDEATRVTLRHDGWAQFGDDAVDQRDRYGRGWEAVLGWFKNWAEWGSPRRLGRAATTGKGYVLQPGEGIDGNGAAKATRRSTMGSLSITESVTVGGAPLHVHRYDDEVFYVLDGMMTVTLEGTVQEVAAGGFVFISRGAAHAWDTIGKARILIISAPGGLEEFLAQLHSWPAGYADAWHVLGERFGYQQL